VIGALNVSAMTWCFGLPAGRCAVIPVVGFFVADLLVVGKSSAEPSLLGVVVWLSGRT
jgi:hypothetical protein